MVTDPLIPPVSDTIHRIQFASAPAPETVIEDNSTVPAADWGTRNATFEQQVVVLTNDHRVKMSLPTLERAADLEKCAGWKALHMANYQYMSHDDPAPPIARSTSQRFTDFHISGGWGENIAYGYADPQAVVSGWLNSPGHRANIENKTYKYLGVGAAKDTGAWYWGQCFGTTTTGPIPPPLPPQTPPTLRFDDRHAIGVYWDKTVFTNRSLTLYVWSGSEWSRVRDLPNTGATYVTYPLPFVGTGRVRLTDDITTVEGTFNVRSLR